MMWRRNLSLFAKLRTKVSGETTDISRSVSNEILPKITGNGPFIELPKFEALGDSGSLLNVTLPALLKLNIRSGSIVAMNGNLTNLRTSIKNLSPIKPLLYQELQCTSPVLILLSGGPHFTVVDLEQGSKWEIVQLQSIISWTGFNLVLSVKPRVLSGLYKLDTYSRISTEGKGKVVLGATSDIFELKLQKDEEIYIDPSALIAYTTPEADTLEFTSINRDIYSSIPKTGLLDTATVYLRSSYLTASRWFNYWYVKLGGKPSYVKLAESGEITKRTALEIAIQWEKLKKFIVLQVRRTRRDDVYVKLKGPCQILVESRLISNKRTFTKAELESIYETM